jgi:hypothetical protein
VAVAGDGWDGGGEPGAVGEAGFDAGCDAVEAFAFDLLEEAFEEGADLAVVVEAEVGDTFDAVAGVSEHAPGPVDHPFLCVGVGEHAFGDGAEPDQVVSEFLGDRVALLLVEVWDLPVERLGLVSAEGFADDGVGLLASWFGGEVDLGGGECVLDADAEQLGGFG